MTRAIRLIQNITDRIMRLSARAAIIYGIGITLLVRLFFVLFLQRTDWDGFFYLIYVQNILAGKWLEPSPQWQPYPFGYPAAIALVSFLTRDIESAGTVVSLLAGVLIVIPLYLIARDLAGNAAGWLTIALVALNPFLADASIAILSESLFLFFVAWWFWLWMREYQNKRVRYHWLWVCALAFALVFTRPLGIGIVASPLLISLFRVRSQPRAFAASLLLCASVGAMYLTYASAVDANLERITGSPRDTYGLGIFEGGLRYYLRTQENRAPNQEIPPAIRTPTDLITLGRIAGLRYLEGILRRVAFGVLPREVDPAPVFPFYLWFVIFAGVRFEKNERWKWLLLVLGVAYFLTVALFPPNPRFYLPLILVVSVYAGVALANLARRASPRVALVLIASVLLLGAFFTYRANPHQYPVPPNAARVLGAWLRANDKPAMVLSNEPAIAFYAGAELYLLRDAPLRAQIDALPRTTQAVIVAYYTTNPMPLLGVSDWANPPAYLVPLTSPNVNDSRIFLFRLAQTENSQGK